MTVWFLHRFAVLMAAALTAWSAKVLLGVGPAAVEMRATAWLIAGVAAAFAVVAFTLRVKGGRR